MARLNINAMRRRQIVDATIAVMARRGWNGTSIDEITKEANVSRGLVSYHFEDKADLLSAVLARCQEVYEDAVSSASTQTDDPVERIRLVVRASLDQITADPVNYEVFLHFTASARTDPVLGEQIRRLWRGYQMRSALAIRAAQRAGVVRADIDPGAAAVRAIGAVTGLALQYLLEPGSFPIEEAARQTEEMLMSYLTGTPALPAQSEPAAESPVSTERTLHPAGSSAGT